MNISITKGRDRDFIVARRVDGTEAKTTFPKKGPFPHDAVHLVVETELRYRDAFWGRIARGANPGTVAALAKAGGHHSSRRAEIPARKILELIHAERIVECFEADIWGSPTDIATFRNALHAGCAQSKVSPPELTEQNIANIRTELRRLLSCWQGLHVGESLELSFSV